MLVKKTCKSLGKGEMHKAFTTTEPNDKIFQQLVAFISPLEV